MTKDKKILVDQDEQDPRTDPLDSLIVAALLDEVLPQIDGEIDPEQTHAALTDADLAGLESLGSPAQQVQDTWRRLELLDQAKAPSEAQANVPTIAEGIDATEPVPGSRFWKGDPDDDFRSLMTRMDAFEQKDLMSRNTCYRKKSELGRGFQGVVYLTECIDAGHRDALRGMQALKIFSPQPYGNADSYHEDMERMGRVASLIHAIQQANVVDIQRFLDHDGIAVMIMKWIDGFDLRRLMQPKLAEALHDSDSIDEDRWDFLNDVIFTTPKEGRLCLQPGVAVYIIEKCLSGLAALHAKEIVHGDVKLSNIMLDCHGSAKLIDVGSAFELKSPPQRHTWTPRYAAPEFLARGEYTVQSDLASLGYVLIELLSGQPIVTTPKTSSSNSTRTRTRNWDPALLEAKLTLADRFPKLLPKEAAKCERLRELCRRLVAADPRDRFKNATEAIIGHYGTFNFSKELTRGNLVVHNSLGIGGWLCDVKRVLKKKSEEHAPLGRIDVT